MTLSVPAHIKAVLSLLSENGHEAYIVGGSLRDAILGRAPADWDITTSALPEQTLAIFGREGYSVIPTGLKHGTVTVLCGDQPVEITTFRTDGEYTDSRHPEKVTFTKSIADDLSRRDFTVNAIAYAPEHGTVDLFGGREDIDRKLIRCVGDPKKRFSEDALRILRAFRFMSKLSFTIETETLLGAREMSRGLEKVSRERVYSELSGLLLGRIPGEALLLMAEAGILPHILSGYRDKYLPFAAEMNRLSPSLSLRLAALLVKAPENKAGEWITSLKMSNEMKAEVRLLLEIKNITPPRSPRDARAFIVRYGELWSLALELWDILGIGAGTSKAILTKCSRERFPRSIRELAVNGGDLLKAGIGTGREMGTVLMGLHEAALSDPSINEKEKLIPLALKMRKRS